MMPSLTLSGDEPVLFHISSLRKFKGARLPGSEYWLAEQEDLIAHYQDYHQPNYGISYRIFDATTDTGITAKEIPHSIRIEAVLDGTLHLADQPGGKKINAGEYRITKDEFTCLHLPANSFTRYIVACINTEHIDQNIVHAATDQPLYLSKAMNDLLTELLYNRYQSSLLPFYYENCVRELFFLHASQQTALPEPGLSAHELTAVHEAERIIRQNIDMHFSIQELARRTGTNEFKLKKDFRAVYKTGLFGRLVQLRMEYAMHLLETTSLAIQDIAEKAGYDTVAGFITAFRKYCGTPPLEWRNRNDRKPPA